MPIERDSIISIPSQQLRPTQTTDQLGNPIAGGPDALVTACVAGAIPQGLRHDPYRERGGGALELRKWLVVVRGAINLTEGDAILIPTGANAGKYRAQVIERVPGETLTLAQCFKET